MTIIKSILINSMKSHSYNKNIINSLNLILSKNFLIKPKENVLSITKKNYITSSNITKDGKLKIAFFGTDLFSVKILHNLNILLNENKIDQINVITSFARPNSTREKLLKQYETDNEVEQITGDRIINFCEKNKIKYYLWSEIKINQGYKNLFKAFDVGLVASFGHLLPASLIETFPYGVVNVHPSILPRWRGASPLVFQVLFDEKIVGVSLMKITPKQFDIGPIISQKQMQMPLNSTTYTLLNSLSILGNQMVKDLIEDFETNINKALPQSNENVCYAHKINSDMFYIDWKNQTMAEIDCQYRGLHEIKHLKTKINDQIAKFIEMFDSSLIKVDNLKGNCDNLDPGTVRFSKKDNIIAIKCKDGFVGFRFIVINRKLTAQDFYNGYLNGRKTDVIFESVSNTIKENIYFSKIKNSKK